MEARSGRVRWLIGLGWRTYLCKNRRKNVQDVIQPTQNFATSTTTVSHSLATSARHVEGIGHGAARLEVSRSGVVAGETKELSQAVTTPPSHRLAPIVKLARRTTLLQYSAPRRHRR